MDLPKHWIAEIFKKFQARYLHKWTSAIDGLEDYAVKEWSEKLGGITGEQIKRGLESWSEDWPPSADEFRKCCIDYCQSWEHGTKGSVYNYEPEVMAENKASEKTVNIERRKLNKLGFKLKERDEV